MLRATSTNREVQHSAGKKTNKHKQLRGIVQEMGGGQIVYVCSLLLGEKGKHINKIPRKSQEKNFCEFPDNFLLIAC